MHLHRLDCCIGAVVTQFSQIHVLAWFALKCIDARDLFQFDTDSDEWREYLEDMKHHGYVQAHFHSS